LVGVTAGLAFSVAAGLCTSVDGVADATGDADALATLGAFRVVGNVDAERSRRRRPSLPA
jgi:hypothetical protein